MGQWRHETDSLAQPHEVTYRQRLDLCGRQVSQVAVHVAPDLTLGALVPLPRRVEYALLRRGAHLAAHTAELPGLLTALADAFLPVRGVRGRELNHWCGLWLCLGLDRLGWWRRFQLFHAVNRVPARKEGAIVST